MEKLLVWSMWSQYLSVIDFDEFLNMIDWLFDMNA